jgi:hypothetical protein
MNKIAFDWQGTLDVNPILLELALTLKNDPEWEVIIISAMPVTMPGVREKEIEAGAKGLPYKVVYHELENYHQAAGEAKVALMKELGIELLVDDFAKVVKTVREAGLKVLQI